MKSRGSVEHLPPALAGIADMAMLRAVAVPAAADDVEAGSVHVRLVQKLQSCAMLRSAATYSAIDSLGAWLL